MIIPNECSIFFRWAYLNRRVLIAIESLAKCVLLLKFWSVFSSVFSTPLSEFLGWVRNPWGPLRNFKRWTGEGFSDFHAGLWSWSDPIMIRSNMTDFCWYQTTKIWWFMVIHVGMGRNCALKTIWISGTSNHPVVMDNHDLLYRLTHGDDWGTPMDWKAPNAPDPQSWRKTEPPNLTEFP